MPRGATSSLPGRRSGVSPRCVRSSRTGLFLTVVLLASPSATQALEPSEPAFFLERVQPLLDQHCSQCHSHKSDKVKGGLMLDSLEAIRAGGQDGAVIVPGRPEQSRLLQAVRYSDPDLQMPPAKPGLSRLTGQEIQTLERWIAAGAVGPATPPAQPRSAKDPAALRAEQRAWWSFQPLKSQTPPPVADPAWSANPIDRFIFDRLQREGLTPSPHADRRTLIRRLYFDLLGLPPGPEEIQGFTQDSRPDAYERLVDRLLESPHYGERWARHWLDLVRYAESDGYKADDYRPDVWRYRDYVIRAFNTDKPYDQFVREQLAGDELAPQDPEALAATTFLRLWIYEYNNRDAFGQWETILNDLTDVTGDVFMGLGMSCARCHDHKYDPILRKDYYRLQAFFTALLPREDRFAAPPAAVTAYLAQKAKWEDLTRTVREKIRALEEPYRQKAAQGAIEKFPEDVQLLLAKPRNERNPYEHQVAELAFRQITYEWDHLDAKIKGDDKERLAELRKELAAFDASKPAPLPAAFTVTDVGPVAPPTRIPKAHPPEDILPGFLSLLDERPAQVEVPPAAPNSTGRRAALAQWLTRPDNPLSTRVIVNRVWQYHFGRGLASSASDFGKLGAPPTHPELLDWLTLRFVEDGWSLKKLHRLILTSATYRQASTAPPPEHALLKDPENRWLWRMPTRRLDAEQVRDALLAAAGELQNDLGGPSVDAARPRRSIYTKIKRNTHDPLLEAFDQPDGINSIPQRSVTTTPTQALMLFNSEQVNLRARALATQLEHTQPPSLPAKVEAAFRRALGREPETWETADLVQFLEDQARRLDPEPQHVPAAVAATEKMPAREGTAALLEPQAATGMFAVPDSPTLPADEFTLEAYVVLKSVYEDGSVRTIAAQWQGVQTQPGWSFGVTGKKSSHKPQHLVLQLAGNSAKGGRYETVFSDLSLQLNTPYYVAVAVRPSEPQPAGVTFYARNLGQDEEPLQVSRHTHPLTGPIRAQVPFTIGGCSLQTQHRFHGLVDEVRLSRRALREEELLIKNEALLEDTVGLWRFESTKDFYRDDSRAQNHIVENAGKPKRLDPTKAAFEDLCHVLLNANEFLYVD